MSGSVVVLAESSKGLSTSGSSEAHLRAPGSRLQAGGGHPRSRRDGLVVQVLRLAAGAPGAGGWSRASQEWRGKGRGSLVQQTLCAPELLVAAISSPLSHNFSSWTLVLLPPSALLSNKIEREPSMVHILNPCIPSL